MEDITSEKEATDLYNDKKRGESVRESDKLIPEVKKDLSKDEQSDQSLLRSRAKILSNRLLATIMNKEASEDDHTFSDLKKLLSQDKYHKIIGEDILLEAYYGFSKLYSFLGKRKEEVRYLQTAFQFGDVLLLKGFSHCLKGTKECLNCFKEMEKLLHHLEEMSERLLHIFSNEDEYSLDESDKAVIDDLMKLWLPSMFAVFGGDNNDIGKSERKVLQLSSITVRVHIVPENSPTVISQANAAILIQQL
jgi:hypothetical protein